MTDNKTDECTYDIIIKCNTEEQRELVREKVDELLNKSCGSVWYDSEGYKEGKRPNITNVYFKESYYHYRDSEERELG